jgi:glutathione reductase (NADPH)
LKTYDAIVLGSGVAGGVAARRLKQADLRVALLEPGPLGGTCPLRGCEPKKTLFDVVHSLERCRNHFGRGLSGDLRLDWAELVRFKNGFTDPVHDQVREDLESRGIDWIQAAGRFTAPDTVEANGEQLGSERFFLATGAVSRPLSFPGAEHLTESAAFFDLPALPERMAVVGGGYIAFEFAHVAARAGTRVDLLVRSGRCLKHFDPDLVDLLIDKGDEMGIRVHLHVPVDRIEERNGRLRVFAGNGAAEVEADLVLHAAGRVPALEGLGLDAGGVEVGEGGIALNEYLQSVSNPRVYAAGDVDATGPQLTPVALMEAEAAVRNILEGNVAPPDYSGVPSVLFAHPTLARTGLLETDCEELGIPHEKRFVDAGGWASVRRLGEETAAVKILTQPEDGRILGAHVLSPHAEEVVNIFALAVRKRIPRRDLGEGVWAYPSFIYDTIRHVLL